MSNRNKNALYSLFLVLAITGVWLYRNHIAKDPEQSKISISGNTMGTTYSVKYIGNPDQVNKFEIDSVLQEFNMSLSTYIPDSEISKFNNNNLYRFQLPYFYPVLEKSKAVYGATKGALDPTVMPLVNAWGFGPDKDDFPDSTAIDSLLHLVDFDSVFFDSVSICKLKSNIQLDFSALAKGYGVDVVGDYLKHNGVEDYLVEIGGEFVAQGKNEEGDTWAIYIEKPESDVEREAKAILELENRAIATSGNYRNFYVKDGLKYAHTISPFTGYPVEHSLLSASVIADDCMTADAYATAFMVLGLEESKEILKNHTELDAYLIFSDENGEMKTFFTQDLSKYLSE